jgi:photosystem II stability/assembly factor-like uncharacterized protein
MRIILIIALLGSYLFSNAQVEITPELKQLLQNKTKLGDIKTTVLTYFKDKLASLNANDSTSSKQIMKQLKKWNRLFWINEFYSDDKGEVANKIAIDKAGLAQVNNFENTNNNNAARQNINWINQGPFNSNLGIGRIDKLAFHPTNANIIYAGSPNGGLFKTTNGGLNWVNISPNIPSQGISGIVVDHTNPQIIYILTGDANSKNNGVFDGNAGLVILGENLSASSGVYKSFNGGDNWIALGTFSSDIYRGFELVMSPTNANILLAATSIGIFRTTNAGLNWQRVTGIGQFEDVKFKPNDGAIVYTTSGNVFFRSTNGGLTFNLVTITGYQNVNRIAIGVTPANADRVVLFGGSFANSMYNGGVFSSSDEGQTFVAMNTTTNIQENQYNFNIALAISPTDENLMFAGGLSAWKSTDGGTNWNKVSDYFPQESKYLHPDIHDLKFNPLNANLFCGNDGGVYSYNGTTWDSKYNGIAASQFYRFEREYDEPNKIWGGTQDNGIQRQNINGAYFLYQGGDGYDVMTDHEYLVDNGEADDVYFTVNSFIFRDNGSSIEQISISTNNIQFFGNLAMSPTDEDKLYVGYENGLYRSVNRGSNWYSLGGTGNWAVATCRNNNERVYTAGTGFGAGRLFRYDLNNSSITDITPPAPYNIALKITDIEVRPTASTDLWISIGGVVPNAKVFTSGNGGANWTNISFNLPNVPIFCIKKDANNVLYVGTSIGVFCKRNGINHWEPFSNGLPRVPVTEIEIWPEPNPVNNFVPNYAPATPEVWISTYGRGIWYTQVYDPSCIFNENLPNVYVNGQIYKEASNSIISAHNMPGNAGNNLKYNAGNNILLTDNFFVGEGATFQTFLEGCGNPIDLNKNSKADSIKVVKPLTNNTTPTVPTPAPQKQVPKTTPVSSTQPPKNNRKPQNQ